MEMNKEYNSIQIAIIGIKEVDKGDPRTETKNTPNMN